MTATRASIEGALRALNEAENSGVLSPAEKSDVIDQLSAPDVRGWANGVERGGRDTEREVESWLFSTFPDYQRRFEHIVIDPPHAAVRWLISGTDAGTGVRLEMPGATILHFDSETRIAEFWLFYEMPPAPSSP